MGRSGGISQKDCSCEDYLGRVQIFSRDCSSMDYLGRVQTFSRDCSSVDYLERVQIFSHDKFITGCFMPSQPVWLHQDEYVIRLLITYIKSKLIGGLSVGIMVSY